MPKLREVSEVWSKQGMLQEGKVEEPREQHDESLGI